MLFVIMVAIVIAVAIAAVVRQPDPVKRAILLRRSGFGLMALSTAVCGHDPMAERQRRARRHAAMIPRPAPPPSAWQPRPQDAPQGL